MTTQNDTDILDSQSEKINDLIYAAITWWEKKRLIFNVSVGVSGVVGIFISGGSFYLVDIIGIVMWGFFANLLFCVGLLLELFNSYYLKSRYDLVRFRRTLFVLGTAAMSFVTLVFAVFYFSWMAFD